MRKVILGFLITTILWATPAMGLDLEAERLLTRIKKVYGQANGFRARYTLDFRGGTVAATGLPSAEHVVKGLMLYGRPDKLRIIQDPPLEEEMVITKDGIWWYTREDNEAHRYPASEFAQLFDPILTFFKGLTDFALLEKSYRVIRHFGGDGKDYQALKLVPHTHSTGISRIEVRVLKTGRIIRVGLWAINGDRSLYTFDTMELLDADPQEGFGFTPPIGARIVHH